MEIKFITTIVISHFFMHSTFVLILMLQFWYPVIHKLHNDVEFATVFHRLLCRQLYDIIQSDVAFYLQPIVHLMFFFQSFFLSFLGFIKHCLHALNNGKLIGWRQRYAGYRVVDHIYHKSLALIV